MIYSHNWNMLQYLLCIESTNVRGMWQNKPSELVGQEHFDSASRVLVSENRLQTTADRMDSKNIQSLGLARKEFYIKRWWGAMWTRGGSICVFATSELTQRHWLATSGIILAALSDPWDVQKWGIDTTEYWAVVTFATALSAAASHDCGCSGLKENI